MVVCRYPFLVSVFYVLLFVSACNPFDEKRTVSVEGDTTILAVVDTTSRIPEPVIDSEARIKPYTYVPKTIVAPASKIVVSAPRNKLPSAIRTTPVHTGKVKPGEIVAFAKTLIGTRYKYGSTDPRVGFDCSGFITYVFNHFNIDVPRSSIDFTNVGTTVPVELSKVGDIILFTGTNKNERFVGHMGIVVSNDQKNLEFIHSTSGKAQGVTITPFSEYYQGRFIKTIRLFPAED